jgi:hypothetical protein
LPINDLLLIYPVKYRNEIQEQILGLALIAKSSFDDDSSFYTLNQDFKSEIESNLLIKGIDALKYLNGLLLQIDIRIKLCKDIAERDSKVSFVPGAREYTLMKLYNTVAGYLDDEYLAILNSKKVPVSISGLTVKEVALFYAYLNDVGKGSITKENRNEIAEKYGHKSGINLRNIFLRYLKRKSRIDINTTNRKSASSHLASMLRVQKPLLEVSQEAYKLAIEDYEEAQAVFDKYF